MKSERRHDLETNTLALEMKVWGDRLRPYSSAILLGIAAVLGLFALLTMWNGSSARRNDAAWDEFQLALLEGDVDFKAVRRAADNEELAGSEMQEWAYVAWADRQLRLAADQYLLNRDAAKERLTAVAAVYEQFADGAQAEEVRDRARLGLARVREMQDRLEDARKEYAKVGGVLQPVAEARLKELEEDEQGVETTVSWLATAELPTPAAPTGPGTPGVRPDFGVSPPSSEAPGTAAPFDPAQTLEQILGGAATGAGERYPDGEGAAAPAADAAGDAAPADEPSAAAAEQGAATEAPAGDATGAVDAPASESAGSTDGEADGEGAESTPAAGS